MISMMRLAPAAVLAAACCFAPLAQAQDVIKIGDINSYKGQPAHLENYKRGMELALDEVNASGGVNGKKVVLVMRDDNQNPGDAVRAAEELISREQVQALSGSFLSNVALALGDFAKQRKVFFLATMSLSDRMIWQNGNAYSFRLRAGTYTQTAMLVEEAVKLKKKRWALVYPNYEFGQSAAATFKSMLKAAQPDVEFVAEQAPPLGKLEPGAVVQAMADAKPDAIFNVLFGADLIKFVRAGQTRGLFEGREVVSLVTGEPENLEPLKDDTPNGWIVTGYPPHDVKTPEHATFANAYQAKFKDYPRLSSVMGYSTIKSITEGMKKAKSVETDKLVAAFANLQVDTPFGRITYRPNDNQSTIGSFIGKTKNQNGTGVMVESRYRDGAQFQPSAEEVRKLRPAQ
ncbi:MAG: ABC transporter substrate-binding protein [Rubrivivax sp.]|nr:ABC transporter substrate-binding protein [Rubrivivax sp.]